MKNNCCPICRWYFQPYNNIQKYCSAECRSKARYIKTDQRKKKTNPIYRRGFKCCKCKQRATAIKNTKSYCDYCFKWFA